ncbi:hypothetical protein Pelo_19248 [Pelomyxa schiedti]|nr:hypothetical protein Pelo_19248 [Pelomyxa schiedti]
MQRVMGRGLATSLVRTLWFDWVRPTIKLFVLNFICVHDGTTGVLSNSYHAVSFALSPLLLSVAGSGGGGGGPGPTLMRPHGGKRVDGRRIADLAQGKFLRPPCDGFVLGTWDPVDPRTPWVPCARGGAPGKDYVYEFDINTKWAAVVSYRREGQPPRGLPAFMTVAKMVPCCCVGGGGGYEGGGTVSCVDVEMPLECAYLTCPRTVKLFMDRSVEREVAVVHSTKLGTVVYVVDVERTFESGTLALLSTTTCDLPPNNSFKSLIVLRNWEHHSPGYYGSRTFIVQCVDSESNHSEVYHMVESSGVFTLIQHCVVDVFRVSDSLFWANT